MPNTAGGLKLPYPAASDPVAQGAAAIQALATAIETEIRQTTLVVIPCRGVIQTTNYGMKDTGQECYLPWAEVRTKGLKWELKLLGEQWSDQANAYSNFQLSRQFAYHGGVVGAAAVAYLSAYRPCPVTPTVLDSGWFALDPGVANDAISFVKLSIQAEAGNTGQNTWSRLNCLARLVAP